MTTRPTRAALVALLALAVAVALVACGGDGTADLEGGSIAEGHDLSGARLTVGSKEFTEQLILGHATALALRAAGAQVDEQIGLEGSNVARTALEEGEIDMYWEYTGTAWITHLGEDRPIPDAERQYRAVAERDLERNGIRWLEAADFENTYAIAVRSAAADELGVSTISELAELVGERPEQATLCLGSEFASRDDGLPGLEEHYGFAFPDRNLSRVQDAVVYRGVDRGEPCNFGSVFSTDGRIAALDLTLLEDDRSFFPKFNPALTVRREVVESNPDLVALAADLARALDEEAMIRLNARVDVDGEFPRDVAEEWLREEGFIG